MHKKFKYGIPAILMIDDVFTYESLKTNGLKKKDGNDY